PLRGALIAGYNPRKLTRGFPPLIRRRFECGRGFFKHKLKFKFNIKHKFKFKKPVVSVFKNVEAAFKISPASRWRDNIFTVGSNPQ
ncbi:hypothetical protein, partial [Salmonella sp. hn-h2]|uniref:hypothetical protein n=1 Tax=Salmonella sp. hn-h2 TaxID=2582611 RepID=UPI001F1679E0